MVKKTEKPLDPSWGYFDWLRVAEEGLRPLAALMPLGKADLPILGKASSHGSQADRLESFSRPCLWAAHWLQATPTTFPASPPESLSRQTIADWFRQGLLLGTNPASPEYWGPTADHHQHTVEMAALVLSLEIARDSLWTPLARKEKEQVARWFATVRGTKLHPNNHLFFGVLNLSFLQKEGFGQKSDTAQIREWLDALESMAVGQGWFRDGSNQTVDYYNAYAFHYYGLWWGRLFGQNDSARTQRWQNLTRQFLPDYARFFAASGENVPFGRSLTYRFNAVAPIALAELCGCSPLPSGQSRRLCSKNLQFFWNHPIRQSQGLLSLGWVDEFPAMTERYSCGGSPYWAAKGLSPSLSHPRILFGRRRNNPSRPRAPISPRPLSARNWLSATLEDRSNCSTRAPPSPHPTPSLEPTNGANFPTAPTSALKSSPPAAPIPSTPPSPPKRRMAHSMAAKPPTPSPWKRITWPVVIRWASSWRWKRIFGGMVRGNYTSTVTRSQNRAVFFSAGRASPLKRSMR